MKSHATIEEEEEEEKAVGTVNYVSADQAHVHSATFITEYSELACDDHAFVEKRWKIGILQ